MTRRQRRGTKQAKTEPKEKKSFSGQQKKTSGKQSSGSKRRRVLFPSLSKSAFTNVAAESPTRLLSRKEGKPRKDHRKTLNPNDYDYQIFQGKQKKDGRYSFKVLRNLDERRFKKGYYRIYLRHIKTGYKRLLAFGYFKRFPRTALRLDKPEKYRYYQYGGRTFLPEPPPSKPQKGWVPTWMMYERFEDDLVTKSFETGAELRSAIFPVRKWYHPEAMVFSDRIMNLDTKVKYVAVSSMVQFVYPRNRWIQNSTWIIRLDRRTSLGKLHKQLNNMMESVQATAEFRHPRADEVVPLEITGFIPLEYIPESRRKD